MAVTIDLHSNRKETLWAGLTSAGNGATRNAPNTLARPAVLILNQQNFKLGLSGKPHPNKIGVPLVRHFAAPTALLPQILPKDAAHCLRA
jgi:hypothetical protein